MTMTGTDLSCASTQSDRYGSKASEMDLPAANWRSWRSSSVSVGVLFCGGLAGIR